MGFFKKLETLEDMRDAICAERAHVDKRQFSHNIVSNILSMIANKFGQDEANRAVRDLKLKRLGWNEIKSEEKIG